MSRTTSDPRRKAPLLLIAAAGLSAVLAAIPLVYLGVRIGEAGWEGVIRVLERPRIPLLLANTVVLAASVTFSAVVLGVASALALSRVRLPAPRVFAVAAVLPLAVPSYLAAFGWLATFPGVHGFWPSWAVLTLVTVPYVTLPVVGALRGAPAGFAEVSRTLGHGPVRTFVSVIWPGIRTSTLAGALLTCLYVLADFGGVALFRYPVLTTAIHQAYGASFDRYYAAVLAGVLVLIALAIFAVERRLRPRREFAVGRAGARPPGRTGWIVPVAAVVLLIAPVGAVAVPIASLVARLMNAQTVGGTDASALAEATVTTIVLSVAGAIIAVFLALPIATLAARYAGRVSRVLETAGSVPLAVPGIVVGLGLVFFALVAVPALYQTSILLAFAYGILFLPKAVGTIRSSIERVPRALGDVAGTLGHAPLATWWRVTMRLARPGILVAALFIAVTAMKELPATLMLRPTGTTTLAVELWARTDIAQYGAAVPYAVALIVLAAIPAALLSPREDRVQIGRQA